MKKFLEVWNELDEDVQTKVRMCCIFIICFFHLLIIGYVANGWDGFEGVFIVVGGIACILGLAASAIGFFGGLS